MYKILKIPGRTYKYEIFSNEIFSNEIFSNPENVLQVVYQAVAAFIIQTLIEGYHGEWNDYNILMIEYFVIENLSE